MRYALTALLGILLCLTVGVCLGYLNLDLTAPGGPQLSASASLASAWCYYDGCDPDEAEIYQYSYTIDHPTDGPLDVYEYSHTEGVDQYGPYYYADSAGSVGPYYDYDEPGYSYRDYEDDYYYNKSAYGTYTDTWYTRAFPGFGQMAQQIIPGQWGSPVVVTAPVYAPPAPPPPPRPTYAQPSCWITSVPGTVAYGKSAQLQWSSFYTSSASLTDFGAVPVAGTRTTPNLTNDHAYTLHVSGQGGSANCFTLVRVASTSSEKPSCAMSVNPSTISRGSNASLAWASTKASSATLSGFGTVSVSGAKYISPRQTTTYMLTISNASGQSASCSATLTVR